MLPLSRITIAIGLFAYLPVAGLAAQSSLAPALPLLPPQQVADPTIEERLASAARRQAEGDLEASLREFNEVARLQRRAGLNAGETFWKIAEVENARGSRLGTARALDAAAREADAFGDLEMQARALFDAAVNYAAANRHGEARSRMERFQRIAASPYISDEVRARLGARMAQ